MKRVLGILVLLSGLVVLGATVTIPVVAGNVEVPVVLQMGKLVDILPEDFEPDWTSLKVIVDNKEVPYQLTMLMVTSVYLHQIIWCL
ncbi:hypothetical protein [Fervidobacterium sp. 2310opik-2]|uniref:hypothetical protein n=1 Tax=Fervidobacterium sp. 2310opik-2 TaxID=1755815 RepID=UPI001F498FF6|nr:hypothetical protein [Fervidobacterium sp. 2310opik-2]